MEYISGNNTFGSCWNLKSITFLGEFETDSEWNNTFNDCKALESAIVPEGVTDLQSTFNGCFNLTSVTLPNSLKTIGKEAFSNCSIEAVSIPDSVEVIEYRAFSGNGIKYIDIPENVETLSLCAFIDCSELEELIVPDTVTSYGDSFNPLTGFDELKILKFSNNCNRAIDRHEWFEAPKLELVIFPDDIEEIEDDFFKYVENKSNLTIQVPEKTVQYFQNKFPEINVVAKE